MEGKSRYTIGNHKKAPSKSLRLVILILHGQLYGMKFRGQTVQQDKPPFLQRKMFPYKEAEKFGKLWLPGCVSPVQNMKSITSRSRAQEKNANMINCKNIFNHANFQP